MNKSGGKKRKNLKANKYTIFYAIFVLIWAGLAMLAGQYVASLIVGILANNKASQPIWVLIFYILSYSAALGLIIWLPKKVWRVYRERKKVKNHQAEALAEEAVAVSASELGLQSWPTFVDIGLVPVAYVVYMIIGNLAQEVMKIFPWFDVDQAQNVGFGYFVTGWEQLAAVIAIVFVAPIAEELIMRGWVYGKLRNRVGVMVAIILTSILFGMLHGQWNVAVTTFVLSLILCGLREITGTIWSGMLLHMLVNGIAFYILYIAVL